MKNALATLLLILASSLPAATLDVPLLKDLRKPVEKKEVVQDERPVVPDKVSPEKRIPDPARIFPGNAVWYFSVPDASRLVADLAESPLGKFVEEPAFTRMLRNNRFGIEHLFADLPSAAVTKERVATTAATVELAADLATHANAIAAAGYIDDEGRLSLAFAFDIGLDREPAFDAMGRWETSFFLGNPSVLIQRGDHSGSYLDTWTMPGSNEQSPAEVAVGFAENIAIVSNNNILARHCIDLLSGGDSVSTSEWGKRLQASVPASASADVIGYIRMEALLKGLEHAPAARQYVAAWADYIGHGGRDGEAMYYGLQFTPEGVRETFLLPSPGLASSSSLIELLAKRLKPAEKFTTPNIFPYQPNPALFLAGQMEGRQLGGLLRQERRLFGTANDMDYFTMPASARRLFSNDLLAVLSGEFGLAFYPARDGDDKVSWLMALPCTGDPTKLLPRAEHQADRAGVIVMSRDANIPGAPAWAVISPEVFRRAGGHYLLVASHGELINATVDQLLANSTFSTNRDFVRALSQAESNPGLVFYFNLPETTVRQYPNLSHIMRTLYPRSSGFNSRPPLTMLRRYAKGVLGAIAPSQNGSRFSRVTVQSPMPMLGALAGAVVLRYPAGLRAEGRVAMEASRVNLQELWMRLQLYSSRYGHFPDNLDDLRASMRGDMTSDEIRAQFTAPAALSRMSPSEAEKSSYGYMAGITANDEPDLPLIIEAAPWSEDFAGMYPDDPARSPNETGDFQPYRQYIRLDGRIVTVPEKRFIEKIEPRMRERE